MIKITREQWDFIEREMVLAVAVQNVITTTISQLGNYLSERIDPRAGVLLELAGDSNALCIINTPLGQGRLTGSIDLVDGAAEGSIYVEKNTWTRNGEKEWRPVWVIRIRKGYLYLGDEEDGPKVNVFDGVPGHSPGIEILANAILAVIAYAPSRSDDM